VIDLFHSGDLNLRFSLHRQRHWFLVLALTAAAGGAHAGNITSGAWTPSGCGTRPEAPALNLKNADAYNASVDQVNAYLKSSRAYIDCLTQEANADIQAVTRSANAAPQACDGTEGNDKA
jgi:hypothetical protein